ncbi:hypothetical protein DPMN_066481 [Dreissena polymorpha]|uniref:Uncharacterized protein n=1 Tax=Dreissena polymorpha TaxID=45954 RepID=A0A9D3YTK1_DREPO|nr:hypothetical protein DPMN_066481 [Dreissena polymorpha]
MPLAHYDREVVQAALRGHDKCLYSQLISGKISRFRYCLIKQRSSLPFLGARRRQDASYSD